MLRNLTAALAAPMELPSEIAFSIGGTDIYWTGILFAAAILSAILLTYFEARRKRLPQDTLVDLCLVMIPMGLLGARIWYVIAHMEAYASNALAILRFWDGGLSIYGAILFSLLGLFVYALKKKMSFPRLLDTLAPGAAFAQAVYLWSDFFAQRGYGAEITSPSLMWFPLCVLIKRTDTVHLAVFFYEFLLCFVVFVLLFVYLRKRELRDGATFLWYLLPVGLGHAAFHAMRTGYAPLIGPFDLVGCVSLILGVAAGVLLLLMHGGGKPSSDAISASSKASAPDDGELAQAKVVANADAPGNEALPNQALEKPGEATQEGDAQQLESDD